MKKISTLLVILFLLVLNACATNYFVQIHTAQSNNVQLIDDEFYFENDEVKIIYDLWSENGNPGFAIKNKTNDFIYIHKDKCFYILNEFASDYYKNESNAFTTSQSVTAASMVTKHRGVSSTLYKTKKNSTKTKGKSFSEAFLSSTSISASETTTEEFTNTRNEKKIIIIPPKSKKIIEDFIIATIPFKFDDLMLYPEDIEEIDTLTFNNNDSPIKFSNIISYSVGKIDNEIKSIQNEFWITEICNIPEYFFEKEIYDNDFYFKGYYYPYWKPNRYFILYDKTFD